MGSIDENPVVIKLNGPDDAEASLNIYVCVATALAMPHVCILQSPKFLHVCVSI